MIKKNKRNEEIYGKERLGYYIKRKMEVWYGTDEKNPVRYHTMHHSISIHARKETFRETKKSYHGLFFVSNPDQIIFTTHYSEKSY